MVPISKLWGKKSVADRQRGFEIISSHQQYVIKMPKRATKYSAGYDIFNNTGMNIIINPHSFSDAIPTYVKAYMLNDEVLKIYTRSSLGFKYGLVLCNNTGIIDADFYSNINNDGHIQIKYYNTSDSTVTLPNNTAIAQAIFSKYLLSDGDSLDGGNDRVGGCGSTTI